MNAHADTTHRFTSESVTEGRQDRVPERISDGVLDTPINRRTATWGQLGRTDPAVAREPTRRAAPLRDAACVEAAVPA